MKLLLVIKSAVTLLNETNLPTRCLRLHVDDNVAVVLDDVASGTVDIIGSNDGASMPVAEPIARGHKIALKQIAEGDVVRKYGVAIGFATQAIPAGAWVHTHNCRSGLDERSHTLDPHTGATTDTRYV